MKLENLYIKFRMFFIFNSVFFDKLEYYQFKGMDLKESYTRARYTSGLRPDFKLQNLDGGKWKEESKLFNQLSFKEKIDRGLIEIHGK